MAISLTGSDLVHAASGSDLALTLPTHQADDFGIIFCYQDAKANPGTWSITVATGWTQLFQLTHTTGIDRHVACFYKKFTSASETNPTATNTSSQEELSASVHVFRGVDPTTAFGSASPFYTGLDTQNDPVPPNPSITTNVDNATLVVQHALNGNTLIAAGPPVGYTLGQSLVGVYNRNQHTAYSIDVGTAGLYTPGDWTHEPQTGSGPESSTFTIALNPAADVLDITVDATLDALTLTSYNPSVDAGVVGDAFTVQHINNYDVPAIGGDQTITSVDTTKAFVLNTNSGMLSGGNSASTANQQLDEVSVGINLSSATNVNFARQATATTTTRAQAAVIEYTGVNNGVNEFLIRGTGTVNLSNTTRTTTATCSTTPTDIDKCVVFISCSSTDPENFNYTSATAISWLSGTDTINFERGGAVGTLTIYYTVVEFTGSNWTVHHGFSGDVTTDTGSLTLYDGQKGTGNTSSVSSWGKAFIYGLFKGDDADVNQKVADLWPVYSDGANTSTVDWSFDVNHVGTDNQHLVYAIENSDANFSVARYTDTVSPTTVTITAVGSLTEAFVIGTLESNTTFSGMVRGIANFGFNSTTEAFTWANRSSSSPNVEFQVVDLSNMAGGAPGVGTTVNAGIDNLSITTYAQYVQEHIDTTFNVDALTLTAHNPSVVYSEIGVVDVQATVQQLTLTSYIQTVDVALDVSVVPATQALSLTAYNVTVNEGLGFTADISALTLTEYNPSVSYLYGFDLPVQALTLNEHFPTLSLPTVVNPNVDSLNLQEYRPEITVGVEEPPTPGDSDRQMEQWYYAQWEALRLAIHKYYGIDDNNSD